MAGHGPSPSANRRRANEPERGDWQATPGIGWQHGEIPAPALGRKRLAAAAVEAWDTWMTSWFASHWGPEDLPNLRVIVALYGKVAGGRCTASERGELRQLMDNYGITKKGQQDRRWAPPKADRIPQPDDAPATKPSRYAHLQTVAS